MDPDNRNRYDPDLTNRPIHEEPAVRSQHDPHVYETPAEHRAHERERSRSSMGWVVPLLLLALVVGAAFWMMGDDDDLMRSEDGVVGTSGRSDAGELGALDAGTAVNFTRIRVADVVGDRTFWVGEGANRALVVIPSDGSGATSAEMRRRFNVGDEVELEGSVAEAGYTGEGLSDEDQNAVNDANGRVIIARRVVLSPASGYR